MNEGSSIAGHCPQDLRGKAAHTERGGHQLSRYRLRSIFSCEFPLPKYPSLLHNDSTGKLVKELSQSYMPQLHRQMFGPRPQTMASTADRKSTRLNSSHAN